MDLDIQMATLEINAKKRSYSSNYSPVCNTSPQEEEEQNVEDIKPPHSVRRSSRKRIRPLETEKRRVVIKPQKLSENNSLKEIHNYYLNKKVKRLPPALETIYEEPQMQAKGKNHFMSNRRLKRFINFSDSSSPCKNLKTKRRSMKAKKIVKSKNAKISMEHFLEKLQAIHQNDED